MQLPASIAVIAILTLLTGLVIWWSYERTQRVLLKKRLKQADLENALNNKANETLREKNQTRAQRAGATVDMGDPWSGLQSPKT